MTRSRNLTKSFSRPASDLADRRREAVGAAPRFDAFRSVKAMAPFTITSQLQLDLAIQCSLDPDVRALTFVASSRFRGQTVEIGMMVAEFAQGRFVLDIVDDRPLRDIDSEGLHLLAIEERGFGVREFTAEEILVEPFASNCRRVWSHRFVDVPSRLTAAIKEALGSGGTMTVGDLAEAVGFEADFAPTLYSLACADLVELDLLSALNANTPVSPRRPWSGFVTPRDDSHV